MPVIECSNGKYRIGSGQCIYDTKEKATEVWVAILAGGKYAADERKISYDYDGVISTKEYQDKAIQDIADDKLVYIISARHDKGTMQDVANKVGIPQSRVFATGSNKAKVEKIKELNIGRHYDNNEDVINEVRAIGVGGSLVK
jgi:soluble P-type ATPase